MKKIIVIIFAYMPITIVLALLFVVILIIVNFPYKESINTFLNYNPFEGAIPIPGTMDYSPSIGKQLIESVTVSIPQNSFENALHRKEFIIGVLIALFGSLLLFGRAILSAGRFIWNGIGSMMKMLLVKLKNKILSPIHRLINTNPSTFEKPNQFTILIGVYVIFLKRYIAMGAIRYILKTHGFFLQMLAYPENIPLQGKELVIFRTPFDQKDLLEKINILIGTHIHKDAYIDNFFIDENMIDFRIKNTGPVTGDGIKKKLIDIENELYRKLPGYNKEESLFGNMKITTLTDDSKVEFTSTQIWKKQELDLTNTTIPKGKALVGFYPEVKNRKIRNINYFIDISKLYHSFVVGTTRSGKDVFILNFVFSILKHISLGGNYVLHFLDTKISDGAYLDGLKSYGVFRYSKSEEYINILTRLNEEMEARQKMFKTDSNIVTYNENNPKTPMKEVILIMNEMLALYSSVTAKEGKIISDLLINLLSKGAGAGFKIFLMGQSMRKDIDPAFGGILTNITTRFSTRITNKDDRDIVARGMPFMDADKLSSLIEFNCAHIDNSSFVQEFRAYHIKQEQVLKWIQATFHIEHIFENEKLNEYFTHIKKNKKISMNEAMTMFGITRSEWDEFIGRMETLKLIKRYPGKAIELIDT